MSKHDRERDTLNIVQFVPSLITILGLCAGLSSIRYVFVERYDIAAMLIIAAAVIDGVDGLMARRLGASSTIGAELDSLSDFVSFGVAPGLLVFHFALADLRGLGWVAVLVFAICCCLRLARFNVSRDAPPALGRAHFVGVPAPTGALLALLPVFLALEGTLDATELPLATAAYLALIGLLMISTLPTFSPKSVRMRKDQAVWALAGVAVLAGFVLTRLWLLMVLADLFYLLALVPTLIRRRYLRRKETPWTRPR